MGCASSSDEGRQTGGRSAADMAAWEARLVAREAAVAAREHATAASSGAAGHASGGGGGAGSSEDAKLLAVDAAGAVVDTLDGTMQRVRVLRVYGDTVTLGFFDGRGGWHCRKVCPHYVCVCVRACVCCVTLCVYGCVCLLFVWLFVCSVRVRVKGLARVFL
jgi:hypothetical protein